MAEKSKGRLWARIMVNKSLYLMLLPVVLYLVIFCYIPMGGIVIAFKDYVPRKGIFASAWVGMKNFQVLFNGVQFPKVLRNTIVISLLRYAFEFPAPIILALLINEVTHIHFKKVVQTAVYMPHFLSWVIASSLVLVIVSGDGPLVTLMQRFGYEGTQSLMVRKPAVYPVLIVAGIWKGAGWGTLIYLAAITGVDPALYESAVLDGATRLQQCRFITLPAIASTIVVLFILKTGSILSAGFDEVYMLQNAMNVDMTEILDTYVYKVGLKDGRYSLSTAVSLFKSLVGLALVLGTNALARRFGDSSLL